MEFRSKILSDRNNFFKGYNLNDVHDWYMDLGKRISDLSGIQSTAPKLLEYYLSPNNQKRNKKIAANNLTAIFNIFISNILTLRLFYKPNQPKLCNQVR